MNFEIKLLTIDKVTDNTVLNEVSMSESSQEKVKTRRSQRLLDKTTAATAEAKCPSDPSVENIPSVRPRKSVRSPSRTESLPSGLVKSKVRRTPVPQSKQIVSHPSSEEIEQIVSHPSSEGREQIVSHPSSEGREQDRKSPQQRRKRTDRKSPQQRRKRTDRKSPQQRRKRTDR